MGLAPLNGSGRDEPAYSEAELLDFTEEPTAAAEPPSKKKKAGTSGGNPIDDAIGAPPSSALAEALGLTGNKRAAPDAEGGKAVELAGAPAAPPAPPPPPAKSAKTGEAAKSRFVKVAWLLEARAPAEMVGEIDGAAMRSAVRAAAERAGLDDVSLSDVTGT